MKTLEKGIRGRPSLVHTPGKLQLAAGGKRRRRYMGRMALFVKADSGGPAATGAIGAGINLGVNSAHVPGDIHVLPKSGRRARRRQFSLIFGDGGKVMEKKLAQTKKERKKVKATMDEWAAGKLHSSSKSGPIVTDQTQAIAIALSQLDKRLEQVLRKANPYHDEGGHFTSADQAASPGSGTSEASRSRYGETNPRGSAAASVGGALKQTVPAVAGSAAGYYAGSTLGAAAGAAGGPAGMFAGRWLGGALGAMAGDYVGRTIASQLFGGPVGGKYNLGADIGSSVGALGGWYAGGAAATTLAALPELSVGGAVARVLGTTAGEIAGTRFGNYAAQRIGGVLKDTKNFATKMYASDTALNVADTGFLAAAHTFGKRVTLPIPIDAGALSLRPSIFPKLKLRNDMNDEKYLRQSPAATRFRTLLNDRETKQKAGAARLAIYGKRPENMQPQPGESTALYHQRLMQVLAEQQAMAFPMSPIVSKGRKLFG